MRALLQYWEGLQPRERQVLSVGAVALLIIGVYALIIEPYQEKSARLEQDIAAHLETLQWMQGAAASVKALQRNGGSHKKDWKGTLLTLVDTSARQSALGDSVKKVEPEGKNGVRVWLEQASFDELLRWLNTLNQQYDVKISGLQVDREDSAGLVSAKVVLEEAS